LFYQKLGIIVVLWSRCFIARWYRTNGIERHNKR